MTNDHKELEDLRRDLEQAGLPAPSRFRVLWELLKYHIRKLLSTFGKEKGS